MSFDIEKNVSKNKLQCSDFARKADESMDITNKEQLIAFVCLVNKNKIANQFLFCKELSVTTKGEDILNILNDYLDKRQVLWKSCVGICTDGAPSMVGCIKGFVSFIKKKIENVIVTHCFLHKKDLMSKTLGENLREVSR